MEPEPHDVSSLLEADRKARLDAIRVKLAANTPLTKQEREFLEGEATPAETLPPASIDDPLQPIWAKSQVELAHKLGCSRKQIQRYLKLEGEDAPPAPASDGRYNVTLWRIWAAEHGHLRKKLDNAGDRQLLEDKMLQLDIEKKEIANATARGELLSIAEARDVIVGMFSQIVPPLRGMKHTLGPMVVGQTVPEATKRIGREVDTQLTVASEVPEWAKKKSGPAGLFWSRLSAELSDLPKRFNLGDGLSST